MSWLWAALMPHPPVIIPEVGKGREHDAAATLKGAEQIIAALAALGRNGLPDVLLVLSPHLPFAPGACFINNAPRITGSLARFGAPAVSVDSRTPQDAMQELTGALKEAGIPTAFGSVADITADHGSIVPLSILAHVFPGKQLPSLILASPSGLAPEQAVTLGDTLRKLPGSRRWALLASGDLSHRLKDDGPYGFNPAGPVFDKAVVEALKTGDPAPLLSLSPKTRENAGECGLRPVLTLLGLSKEPVEVYSYEGPFGVGYCTAFWNPQDGPRQRTSKITVTPVQVKTSARQEASVPKARKTEVKTFHPYAQLARKTVSAHLKSEPLPTSADILAISGDKEIWTPRGGCFVSIKNKDGSLRGCIGTFMPTQPGLDAEIINNAILASTRDHRFPPMKAEELENVRFSVDVLSTPELVAKDMELDPAVWGVIVVKDGRRGLLLPDLPGVTGVEQQLAIAAQKGGIRDLNGAEIYRFYVIRHLEGDAKGEEA